ncbi:putative WD repeat-containing protein [Wickerhamomyces ciferrii]|uniref:WD repeat-containing protein n=1 Tax=Wickerhamomyces ciferrii (strain ATCC 14091 / BCRC 22168 / CBS 111 / JCM 3599 / NBRC 0793 / NRRL Y-1031 F-60-10) TaxID=1206466 RepID=K0KNT9_WICCF|nr:putative WD repeat-containing protein [Wickerhamomyces ciferrii]CCH43837.1 putative WD repeat-containing protein [Wickerhamomyces ciferrii]
MSEEYRLSLVSGGQPLPIGATFTEDGRHYIVPFNNQLKVYFISTRQCIRSLKFNKLNNLNLDNLVSIKLDTVDPNLIWCFLSNGDALVINWKEKLVNPIIKTFKLDLNKDDSLLEIVQFNNESFTVITGKDSNKPHTRNIIQYTITDNTTNTLEHESLSIIRNVILFTISKNTNKLLFLSKSKSQRILTIVDLTSKDSNNQTIVFPYKSFITSLAISNDSTIAVGTSSGVIHLIYENSTSTTRILKWHIDQVLSLSFHSDSNYLISGGLERVLVFWQLDTEKQQFLPRLNGDIISINSSFDEYISLTLKLDEQNNSKNYEILLLSSLDLKSRLSINGPRQEFNSDLNNVKKLIKSMSKSSKIDISKLKYDFTSFIKIHPITKQIYIINGYNLQIFDFFKNEQISIQKISESLQIGKVRSEHKILDPSITKFEFTNDGKWMATIEEHHHGEIDNLLSQNDLTYILKIWKFVESTTKNPQSTPTTSQSWELVTKIINPHGQHVPIISLISAPSSYFQGIGFLTADNNGGVRLWRSNSVNGSNDGWSLRKLKPSSNVFSNSVSLTWSKDSSLIFLGFEDEIISIDTNTFEEIENPEINNKLQNIAGSRIKSLDIVDNNLIILSKTSIKSINLLNLKENDLVLSVNQPKHGENLITINHIKNLIAIAVNYFNPQTNKLNSKVFVFKPTSKTPIFIGDHDDYITSINWNFENDFIFIDIKSKIGLISNSKINNIDNESAPTIMDYAQEMSILLNNAQSSSEIYKTQDEVDDSQEINGQTKSLDINSFNNLYENLNSIQLDTLFERVMQVIN